MSTATERSLCFLFAEPAHARARVTNSTFALEKLNAALKKILKEFETFIRRPDVAPKANHIMLLRPEREAVAILFFDFISHLLRLILGLESPGQDSQFSFLAINRVIHRLDVCAELLRQFAISQDKSLGVGCDGQIFQPFDWRVAFRHHTTRRKCVLRWRELGQQWKTIGSSAIAFRCLRECSEA